MFFLTQNIFQFFVFIFACVLSWLGSKNIWFWLILFQLLIILDIGFWASWACMVHHFSARFVLNLPLLSALFVLLFLLFASWPNIYTFFSFMFFSFMRFRDWSMILNLNNFFIEISYLLLLLQFQDQNKT